jgi:hypothetical protein
MDRTAAIDRLQRHETELKGLGVQRLYLFGSTAAWINPPQPKPLVQA